MTGVGFVENGDRAVRPIGPAPPAPPLTLRDTGLPVDLTQQLLLKSLYAGEASGIELADALRLSYAMLDALLQHVRAERLIEVRGSSGAGNAGYRYALTDLGRDRARAFFEGCAYLGPAPVPLAQYVEYMRALSAARSYLDRQRVAMGFSHLVVNTAMLDRLGPAINSGKSLFLYGPPGNGKTVIAEGIARAMGGEIFVPHAIEVGGQIITVFDPVNHRELAEDRDERSVIAAPSHDRRWARIRRPVVVVGGELTLDMLDLSFNPIAKFYEAPIQLKANAGVFVVDDFGRQRCPPRDLLNRWIVPLESRRDYLTLQTGRKFEVPFDVLIIFATNLKPESLADEAFLRRIPYKIAIPNPTLDDLARIFKMNCDRHGVSYDAALVEHLDREYYQRQAIPMRSCHPRDLIDQMVDLCRYQGRPPAITRELLDAACRNYFVEDVQATKWETRPGARRNDEVA